MLPPFDNRPNTLISNSKLIVNCQRTAVLFVVFPFLHNVYNSTTNPISTHCEKMFLMKIFGDAIFPYTILVWIQYKHTRTRSYIGSILGWNFPVCAILRCDTQTVPVYIGSCLWGMNNEMEWTTLRMWTTFYGLLWDDEWYGHTGFRVRLQRL